MFDFLADYLFKKEEQPTMTNFNARFEMLNALKNHWWKKNKPSYVVGLGGRKDSYHLVTGSSTSASITVQYGDEIEAVSDTEVIIKNPGTISVSYNTYSTFSSVKGKYFKNPNNGKVYQYSSGSVSRGDLDGSYFVIVPIAYEVTISKSYVPDGYVQSSDRHAYPDSGEQDGYEYHYLGVPFENAVGAPKIETGSYIGTGTYGEDNPNTLTFGFVPKIWGVYGQIDANVSGPYYATITNFIFPWVFALETSSDVVTTTTGQTASWYAESAVNQCNFSGYTYFYFAIC